MLSAFKITAKIQDEGLESNRIQQVGHGRLAGFNFSVGDGEHGVSPFMFVPFRQWCYILEHNLSNEVPHECRTKVG